LADGIPMRGDVNQDNSIDAADVQSLATAIVNVNAFQQSHPALTPNEVSLILDVDQDGVIDNLDVQSLLSAVASSSTGGGELQAVREPAASALGACGAMIAIVALQRRRRT